MAELVTTMPPDGWSVDDLDRLPVSNQRYELTDGALTVSPSPSSLHQAVAARLVVTLSDLAPQPLAVTGAVEIRFAHQLTRIPDVLVVRSDDPARHWFAPPEVVVAVEIESPGSHLEDRTTKPALYAHHGIPFYWRIETAPLQLTVYRLVAAGSYSSVSRGTRLQVTAPFPVDMALSELLPRWGAQ